MDLNLRNVPEELLKGIRVAAAEGGVTLRAWALDALEVKWKVKYTPKPARPNEVVARVEKAPAAKNFPTVPRRTDGLCEHGADPKFCRMFDCVAKRGGK